MASPRRLLAGAGVLLLAGAGIVGTGANFNATAQNPAGVFTAGIVHQTNSSAGTAVLTAANLAPGATPTGTVDISNSGDLAAVESLTVKNLVDTPTAAAFSAHLQFKIEDLGPWPCTTGCPAAVVLYSGTLRASVGTRDLSTFQPGAKRRYRFTVTYPSGGAGADNAYGGAAASVELGWGARQ